MTGWARAINELRGGTRGCDVAVALLASHGVRHLFGLPADSINALFDASRKRSGIDVITCRHEGGAALMASAYGKLTGQAAAVTATNGPGATHLPPGCRDALLDGAPMVVLPGGVPHALADTAAFQEVDSTRLLSSVVAAGLDVWAATGLARLGPLVSQSLDWSLPVSATIAVDVLTDPAPAPSPQRVTPAGAWATRAEVLHDVGRRLDSAVAPIAVIGDLRRVPAGLIDAIIESAFPYVIAPSAMQGPGWGRLDASRRLCGDHATPHGELADADLVLVLGGWPGEVLAEVTAPTVVLTSRPYLVAAAAPSTTVLGESWRSLFPSSSTITTDPVAREKVPREPVPREPASPMHEELRAVDELLSDNATVCLEPGLVSDAGFQCLSEQSRRFTSSYRAATRGYAIPAAVAAAVAFPHQPAIAVVDLPGWVEGHIELLSSLKHHLGVSVIAVVRSVDDARTVAEQAAAFGMVSLVARSSDAPETLAEHSVLVLLADQADHAEEAGARVVHTPRTPFSSALDAAELAGRDLVRSGGSLPDGLDDWALTESAGLFAVGLAKADGRAPILVVESEVDLLRQLNGIHDASYDRAPVVVVTIERAWQLDSARLLGAVAALTLEASEDDDGTVLARACDLAEEFTDVVHVRAATGVRPQVASTRFSRQLPRSAVAMSDSRTVKDVSDLLWNATRPVIVAGAGAHESAAQILTLAELTGARVVATMSTFNGVDLSPHFAGYVGSSGHRSAQGCVEAADVLLVLGVSNRGGAFGIFGGECVIDVNLDRSALESRAAATWGVVASCMPFVEDLLTTLAPRTPRTPRTPRALPGRDPRPGALSPRPRSSTMQGALRPSHVVRVLDDATKGMTPSVGFAADVGLNTLWLFRFRRSHATTMWTRNFATMGFALPAAVATSIRQGRRPVIAVMGDGGMGMAMPGLVLLGRDAPPVLAVVLDNGRLGAIRYEQEIYGWPEFESGLLNGNIAAYARASGWGGTRIETPAQLAAAVDDFLAAPTPTVLQVLCTPDEPPVPAGTPTASHVASMAYSWARQGRRGAVSAARTLPGVWRR